MTLFGINWIWILVVLLPVLIPAFIVLVVFLVSLVDSTESSPLGGGAKLNCYHCGQETESGRRTCVHCGGELQ